MKVDVVGGGVVGLSCAYHLARAGHDVTVVTAGRPEESTSAVAGGVIYPPDAEPAERVTSWTAASVAHFRDAGAPGVRMRPGWIQLRPHAPDPSWLGAMIDPVRTGDRLDFTTALVDTPLYLSWLASQVADAGVRTEYRTVSALSEVDADLVVNAAGLGGGRLAGDDTVVPVGGQVVHLADPGLDGFAVDESTPIVSYVIPHGRHVVCGGTEEPGRAGTEPEPAVTTDILRRCRELVPALRDSPVLAVKVGLRPYRPHVRVERVGDVIHCYGHGGAGITLAWGCAGEVAALAG